MQDEVGMTLDRIEAYRRMLRIRRFEEEGSRLYRAGEIPGAFHASIGQEAAVVGACMVLRTSDYMTGTHRSHGHPIGKGGKLKVLMAELMGKSSGICKGRGGSMHLADKSVGIIGESAIVGGGIPLATGCALSIKVRRTDQVALCFFGDGAVNQGTFHECLNMASLWKLPVIFFCENNGYAITTSVERSHGQPSIAKRAQGYGLPGTAVDGQDLALVFAVTREAVGRARAGEGPTLIEAKTYRFDEHQVGLTIPGEPYRTAEEIDLYRSQRDPIALFEDAERASSGDAGWMSAIKDEVEHEIEAAIAFARESDPPRESSLADFLFSPSDPGLSAIQTKGVAHD
jgi:pyruvate dehydrogenase E1 component alpha subunit